MAAGRAAPRLLAITRGQPRQAATQKSSSSGGSRVETAGGALPELSTTSAPSPSPWALAAALAEASAGQHGSGVVMGSVVGRGRRVCSCPVLPRPPSVGRQLQQGQGRVVRWPFSDRDNHPALFPVTDVVPRCHRRMDAEAREHGAEPQRAAGTGRAALLRGPPCPAASGEAELSGSSSAGRGKGCSHARFLSIFSFSRPIFKPTSSLRGGRDEQGIRKRGVSG